MADGKWIEGLTPEMPVVDAARLTLEVRFKVIEHHLSEAVKPAPKDPEPVHQLRVGTRRAVAALDMFAGCFKKKKYSKVRRRLAELRRAAGGARDWDVFLITLAADPASAGPVDFLFGYARGQRDAAQEGLDAVALDYPNCFHPFAEKTLGKLQPPETPQRLADLAPTLLQHLIEDLHEAAQKDLHDYEHLHRVRILGKRLRYAMEVSAPCYAPGFREELYPQVEEMQEILGRANDHHVATDRLRLLGEGMRRANASEWRRVRPGIEKWVQYHRKSLPKERRTFITWWQRWKKHDPLARLAALTLK